MKHSEVTRGIVACFIVVFGVCGPLRVAYSESGLLPSEQASAMLRAKGVMIGYEDGSMRWENTVTRAEAVKILLAAIGEVSPALARSPLAFLDVSRFHWAFGHITMAAEIGLVRGRPGNVFDPEQGVTMAEFMVMVSRVYAGLGSRPGEPDPRVRVKPAWAEPEIVGWPDLVELVTGESLSVDLDYPASRGEVGVVTGLMMERLGLAYDLTGLVERLSDDGTKMVLAVEAVGGPIEVPLDDKALWFASGAPGAPEAFIGHGVKIVLGPSGKASVIVRL